MEENSSVIRRHMGNISGEQKTPGNSLPRAMYGVWQDMAPFPWAVRSARGMDLTSWHLLFFHPDYTVGTGIVPAQPL